jgi:hypothetical protein
MMGMRMPETRSAVFKRQVINLRICYIWLVDSVEKMISGVCLAGCMVPILLEQNESGNTCSLCTAMCLFVSDIPQLHSCSFLFIFLNGLMPYA